MGRVKDQRRPGRQVATARGGEKGGIGRAELGQKHSTEHDCDAVRSHWRRVILVRASCLRSSRVPRQAAQSLLHPAIGASPRNLRVAVFATCPVPALCPAPKPVSGPCSSSGLYLNIYPPGQILETLSVFPASAESSLAQWHQHTNGQHQCISFGFPGRLVDEGADACVVVIVKEVSDRLSVSHRQVLVVEYTESLHQIFLHVM